MEKNICCLAPSILKGAFKCFAARGNEWVKLKGTGWLSRTISLNTCIEFALIWVVTRSWSVLKDFTWQNVVVVFFLQKWSKSWNPRARFTPFFGKERSFKTKMYIICIAWTTYSRWNLFCSISRILFSRLPLLQGAPFLVCSTKQNTTLWQTMPPIAGPAQKLEFDICRLFRSGSPMPAAAGCASRPPLQSQSTHLHWNTGCCYVTTWIIKRRKSV